MVRRQTCLVLVGLVVGSLLAVDGLTAGDGLMAEAVGRGRLIVESEVLDRLRWVT